MGHFTIWPTPNKLASFNPCSGGLAVGTLPAVSIQYKKVSFNPCSGGLAVGTITVDGSTIYGYSFNPCSGGLAVGTYSELFEQYEKIGFQSLFWWISCWDTDYAD